MGGSLPIVQGQHIPENKVWQLLGKMRAKGGDIEKLEKHLD